MQPQSAYGQSGTHYLHACENFKSLLITMDIYGLSQACFSGVCFTGDVSALFCVFCVKHWCNSALAVMIFHAYVAVYNY